ncbi:MAG: ATP-binding cassette domain-containing protein [Roseibium sp.]
MHQKLGIAGLGGGKMSGVVLNKPVKEGRVLQVVHGIDLQIDSNEFEVQVGPSGCGKSATLQLIADLQEIDSGWLINKDLVISSVAPQNRRAFSTAFTIKAMTATSTSWKLKSGRSDTSNNNLQKHDWRDRASLNALA